MVHFRAKWLPREKAAIIYLRKNKNYSITHLETLFGRSRSLIHKLIKFNETLGAITHQNLRTMPNQTRLKTSQRIRLQMDFWISKWMPFILGEQDKPP